MTKQWQKNLGSKSGLQKTHLVSVDAVSEDHGEIPEIAQPHGEDWAVPYADMITVLLCFFLMMFSVTATRTEGGKSVFDQIAIAITSISGVSKDQPVMPQSIETLKESATKNQSTQKTSSHGNGPSTSVGSIMADAAGVLSGKFGGKALVRTEGNGKVLWIDFPAGGMFESGRAELSTAAAKDVEDVTRTLRPYMEQVRVTISGHTDPRPIQRSESRVFGDNMGLGFMRGSAARKVFIRNGFQPADVRVSSAGEFQPPAVESLQPTNNATWRRVSLMIEVKP